MATINFLCLDGGGVRGLSTLLILRKLLCLVNIIVNGHSPQTEQTPLLPGDVFDLISGTSTGGLIAIMIVKLGMDVDECIAAYKIFAQDIFSKPHPIGRLRHGLGRFKKYRSTDLRKVVVQLVTKRLNPRTPHAERYRMEETETHQNFRCAVLCNELDRDALTRRDDVVFLCSEKCRPHIGYKYVTVADAACATTAAPTYFKHVEVLGKFLVDGGYGDTNNPSFETWGHYQEIKPHNRSEDHIIVNIGTGSKPLGYHERKGFAHHSPSSSLKEFILMIKDLKRIATASDKVGRQMDRIAKFSEKLCFDRFSADCGNIHRIKLDAYKSLDKIEELTNEYLKKSDVLAQLEICAQRLAETYKARKLNRAVDLSRQSEPVNQRLPDQPNLLVPSEPVLLTPAQQPQTSASSFESGATEHVETIHVKGEASNIIRCSEHIEIVQH